MGLMRFFAVVAFALTTAACGASAAPRTPISFGVAGGNVIGYRVTIQPNGSVHVSGSQRTVRRHIAPARVRQLRSEIEKAHLASRECAGALPDLARLYVRVGGRTFTVHGDCEARFGRVWNDLARAVALRS